MPTFKETILLATLVKLYKEHQFKQCVMLTRAFSLRFYFW